MSNMQALRNSVAEALKYNPSKQPVHTTANDEREKTGEARMDAKKSRQTIGAGYKAKQKGNPNKSFSVKAIDKASKRMG